MSADAIAGAADRRILDERGGTRAMTWIMAIMLFLTVLAAALGLGMVNAAGALDRLEAFASFHGPDFYGLPRNASTLTLAREDWRVPDSYPFGDADVKPLEAGELLHWRVVG